MSPKFTLFIVIAVAIGIIWFLGFRDSGTLVEMIPENAEAENTTMPVMVQYRIKEMTSEGEFNDSLYFTKKEWADMTKEELDKMVKARVDNWVNLVKNPPTSVPESEVSKEELQTQAQELQRQIEELQMQLNEINTKLNEK